MVVMFGCVFLGVVLAFLTVYWVVYLNHLESPSLMCIVGTIRRFWVVSTLLVVGFSTISFILLSVFGG